MKPTERKNPGESKDPRFHGIHWVPGSGCFWSWICISHPPRFCKPTNILFMFKPTWTDFLILQPWVTQGGCFSGLHSVSSPHHTLVVDKHLLTLQDSVLGNSLVVQWLGLSAFTVIAQVQSLIPQAMWHGQKKNTPKTRFTSSTIFLWTVLNKSSSPL